MTQVRAAVLITCDVDNTIALQNISETNLHADDVRFVRDGARKLSEYDAEVCR